jgi:hypothetical protein
VEKYVGEKSDSVYFDLKYLKSVLKGDSSTHEIVGWMRNKASSGDLEKAKISRLFWK